MSNNGYIEISDNLIKRMINNHHSYRRDICIARKQLLQEINVLEDMIDAAINPGKGTDNVGGGKTNKIQDPTYDSVIRLQAGRYREKIQIKQEELLVLEKREEAFDRVCCAFKKTFWVLPLEFEIVNQLYYTATKMTTWDAVCQDLNISKATISESRKWICKLIRIIYDSDIKNEDIDGVTEQQLYTLIEESGDLSLLKHID